MLESVKHTVLFFISFKVLTLDFSGFSSEVHCELETRTVSCIS